MRIICIAFLALLAACSSDKSEEATTSPFSELHEPIDKAEDVERQIMQQKERMDAALEAAERDAEPEQR